MRVFVVTVLLALVAALPSGSQLIEQPVSFDAEGRILTMTPPLAVRLGLAPPVWPVTGPYTESRLYDRGDETFVLVVARDGGVVERYPLGAAERDELIRAVTEGMATTGGMTTMERPDLISMPAKGQFVRNQTVGAGIVYGPCVAAFADEGAAQGALYWATVGTTFFVTAKISKGRDISKAQNHMATDGIWRGALIGNAMLYIADPDNDDGKSVAAATLAGSLAGTALGYHAGAPLTDGEARAATFGSTLTTLVAGGLLGTAGAFQGDEPRAEVGALVAASLAGYPVGLGYARRAPYGVTAGDVDVLATGSILGAIGASSFIADADVEAEPACAVVTAGLLAGAWLSDHAFVRRYDFTESEGRLMSLGALAGSLVAMAIPTAAESDDARVYLGLGTAGGVAGMLLTRHLLEPKGDSQLRKPSRLAR